MHEKKHQTHRPGPTAHEIFRANSLSDLQLLYVKIATNARIKRHDVRRPIIRARKASPSRTHSTSKHWQSKATMVRMMNTIRYIISKLKDIPAQAHEAGGCVLVSGTGKYISTGADS